MYSLTEKRHQQIAAILDDYSVQLSEKKCFDPVAFEMELRDALSIGYREIKSIALDLFKEPRFKLMAAYFMQNNTGGTGVASEYKQALAELYGLRSYDSPGLDSARDDFWRRTLKAGIQSE